MIAAPFFARRHDFSFLFRVRQYDRILLLVVPFQRVHYRALYVYMVESGWITIISSRSRSCIIYFPLFSLYRQDLQLLYSRSCGPSERYNGLIERKAVNLNFIATALRESLERNRSHEITLYSIYSIKRDAFFESLKLCYLNQNIHN